MKRLSYKTCLILVACSGLLASFSVKDVVTDLGLTKEEIDNAILDNLQSNELVLPAPGYEVRQAARKLSVGGQVAAVRALGQVVKTYSQSAELLATYRARLDEEYATSGPAGTGSSEDEEDKRPATPQEMENARQGLLKSPPNTLALALGFHMSGIAAARDAAQGAERVKLSREVTKMEGMLKLSQTNPLEFRKQYADYMYQQMLEESKHPQKENPADPEVAEMKKMKAEYESRKNVKQVLRQRLRNFLDYTATVDFTAKLKTQGKKQYFVNPAYEEKPQEWKMLFRAGKEPVMAARAFAQEWLQELK